MMKWFDVTYGYSDMRHNRGKAMKSNLLSIVEALRPKGENDVLVIDKIADGWTHMKKNRYYAGNTPAEEFVEQLEYVAGLHPADAIDVRVEKTKNGTPIAHVVISKGGVHKPVSFFAYEAPKAGEAIVRLDPDQVFIDSEVDYNEEVEFIGQQERPDVGLWTCHSTKYDGEMQVRPANEMEMKIRNYRTWKYA